MRAAGACAAAALLVAAALGAGVVERTFSSPSATTSEAQPALDDHGARQHVVTKRAVAPPRCRTVRKRIARHGRPIAKRVRVCRPRRAPSPRIPPPVRSVPLVAPPRRPVVAPPSPPAISPSPPAVEPPPEPPPSPGSITALSDDDGGSPLYAIAGARPGTTVARCVRVTYANDEDQEAEVRMYATGSPGTLDPLLDVGIEAGTRPAGGPPGCSGFVPTGAPVFTGTLAQLMGTHSDYASGVPTTPAGKSLWDDGDVVAYRVSVTLRDDAGANGGGAGPLASGSHTYVWEARYG